MVDLVTLILKLLLRPLYASFIKLGIALTFFHALIVPAESIYFIVTEKQCNKRLQPFQDSVEHCLDVTDYAFIWSIIDTV